MPAADYSYEPDPALNRAEPDDYEPVARIAAPASSYIAPRIVRRACGVCHGADWSFNCATCLGHGYIITEVQS